MANTHLQFVEFDQVLNLSDNRKASLKTSRRKLREKIRNEFKEKHEDEIQPKFWSQGSFQMGTAINPIARKITVGEDEKVFYKYDVDDGIYFIGKIENRKTVQTYHDWIWDAVNGHTAIPPIDKNTCVRTIFADGHHIDQPIYFEVSGAVPDLAHKAKNWLASDPREFTEWFNKKSEKDGQLCRLVRYIKGWADYQNYKNDSKKMPSGLALTIWVTENVVYSDRDDISTQKTLANIYHYLKNLSPLVCYRPTTPIGENIVADYKFRDYFIERLKAFAESSEQALNESSPKKACGKWQLHFGDRFNCSNLPDIDEKTKVYAAPVILKTNAKSA